MEESVWTSGDRNAPPTAEATHPEPLAEEPMERVADPKHSNIENVVDNDAVDAKAMEEGKAQRDPMERSTSSWTGSGDSDKSEGSDKKMTVERKKWSEKINPLKRKHVPAIPGVKGPSPEYTANFWSRLTFQWMAPLMNVRISIAHRWSTFDILTYNRSVINEHWSSMTYGLSILIARPMLWQIN